MCEDNKWGEQKKKKVSVSILQSQKRYKLCGPPQQRYYVATYAVSTAVGNAMLEAYSFVTTELVPLLSIGVEDQHGHRLCWMSTGRKNVFMCSDVDGQKERFHVSVPSLQCERYKLCAIKTTPQMLLCTRYVIPGTYFSWDKKEQNSYKYSREIHVWKDRKRKQERPIPYDMYEIK